MSVNVFFVTGIGTGIGKTVASAILVEALEADYWKPVQAGHDTGTDTEFVHGIISNKNSCVHPETYKLNLAASPHIAAREEGVRIEPDKIAEDFQNIITSNLKPRTSNLVIEGAGGLLVPLNECEFVIDLIRKLNAKIVLVSRNYLGSINHSLLTAAACRQHDLNVAGWIFNDHYLNYEEEIVQWSGYSKIYSVPPAKKIDALFIKHHAAQLRNTLASIKQ